MSTCKTTLWESAHLALCELLEGLVGHDEGHVRLRLRRALIHAPRRLEVDRPHALLALRVLHAQLEDAVGLWVARG